jgi:RNA methyltransferase, TrmH family
MISKPKARLIKSLQVKKYRLAEQCFIVQGTKAVQETLRSDFEVLLLLGTEAFLRTVHSGKKAREVIETSEKELTSLGSVETNSSALAVVRMKPNTVPVLSPNQFTLLLDDIRDPGNLGSIIRTADWYGVKSIIASPETTDVYNPKVISATMGSFLRVSIYYSNLELFLESTKLPVFGAFLDGENVHTTEFGSGGMIVIGNESKGISPGVEKRVTRRVTVPRKGGAESLNASVATAVILDNVFRRL